MIPFVVISMLNNLSSYGLVEEMKGTLNHCAYSCERVISVVQISSYYGTPLLGNAQKSSCFKFLIVCYYVLLLLCGGKSHVSLWIIFIPFWVLCNCNKT